MQLALLIAFLSLVHDGQTAVCNTSLNVKDNTSDVYNYGDTIHFSCEVLNTTLIDESHFFLWNIQNSTKIPITDIKGYIGYTDVKVYSKEAGGTYSCHYGNCSDDTLLSAVSIQIDACSIPRHDDFTAPPMTCTVNDLDNMTCDWIGHANSTCATWKAMIKTEGMDSYKCCSAEKNDNCTSTKTQCYVTNNDFSRFSLYNISLTRITEQGIHVYHYTVMADDSIVRINIDAALHVDPGDSPYRLVLGLTLHHPPDAVGWMICNVSYISQLDNNDNKVITTHNMTQSTIDVTVTLDGLSPYTDYRVDVLCRPHASPYWSNPVSGSGRTRPAVCDSVPDIVGYSDTKTDVVGQRKLFLYLKPLQKRQWYGHTYYLVSMDSGDPLDNQVFSADTVTGDLNGTFISNQSYSIRIHSENEAGVSNLSVEIDVSDSGDEDKFPVTVIVEEAIPYGRSQVILFPECADDITSVTYYICQGESKFYPPICKTEIQNVTVPRFMKTFLWDDMKWKNYKWYYGVTINRLDSLPYNRIMWSSCVFPPRGELSTKQLVVSASTLPSNSSVISVFLHFEYCKLRQRPLSYHVGFWNTNRNLSNYCRNNMAELQNFTATPSTREIQVYVGSMVDVTMCLRVQYQDQFDISEDIIPVSTSKTHTVAAGETMEKGKIIPISVTCSVFFTLLLVLLMVFFRKKIKEIVNKNKIPDEIIASILQDSPEEMSTQNCIWSNENESSGVSTIRTSSTDVWDHKARYQRGVEQIEHNQSSTSGFNETSRLESDLTVLTEGDYENNVGNYLEPKVNSSNDSRTEIDLSCTEYQLAARQSTTGTGVSSDGYLAACVHQRDAPVGEIIRENIQTLKTMFENQVVSGNMSSDASRVSTSDTGVNSIDLRADEHNRAVVLPKVNSACLTSDEYLVANMHAESGSGSIPPGRQSFETESLANIHGLRVQSSELRHSASQFHLDSSCVQESSLRDEYMKVCGESTCSTGFSNEGSRTVTREISSNSSNFTNNGDIRSLNLESLAIDASDRTDGFQVLGNSGREGRTSGDTVLSDFESTDEYQKADVCGYSNLEGEYMTELGKETATSHNIRDDVFKEKTEAVSSINEIQFESTPDFHSESPHRHIQTEHVEMKEIRLADGAIQNSNDMGRRNYCTVNIKTDNGELFAKEDFEKALDNINEILENDKDSATEYTIDSYTLADVQYSIDSYALADVQYSIDSYTLADVQNLDYDNHIDTDANLENNVANSSQ